MAPTKPPASYGNRIPSLDGARATAIGLVLLDHLVVGQDVANRIPWLAKLAYVGHLGVDIFFVLSGFLITNLLLAERAKTGGINLPRFYFRRTLRIFPAVYAFLVIVLVAALLWHVPLTAGTTLSAFVYASDYVRPGVGHFDVTHLWSLAVEEQFYLLWPATLLFLNRRWATYVATTILFVSPLCRVVSAEAAAHGLVTFGQLGPYRFDTNADALAIGCVLALMRPTLHAHRLYEQLLRSWWFPLVPVLAVGVIEAGNLGEMVNPWLSRLAMDAIGSTIVILCIALMLDRVMLLPDSREGRLLSHPVAVWMGTLSYSLYVWQMVFLMPNDGAKSLLTLPGVNIACALTFACLSYYLVERPCLAWRSRMDRRLFQGAGREQAQTLPIVKEPLLS